MKPQASNDIPTFSVVVPVYGCSGCLEVLCERLAKIIEPIAAHYEIVLIDDRSPDGGWGVIKRLVSSNPNIKGIRLSRNYGQHIAISAGLAAARGEYVVVMDCDLQDPPERIPELYAKAREGYDIVVGRRMGRTHSAFRLFAAKLYFNLISRLTEERVDGSYGTFSILTRKVVESFLQFRERERHYMFILRWLGFEIATVDYRHAERASGRSSYSMRKLLRHAIDGVLFQATVLLRWIVAGGLLFAVFGLMLAFYFVYQYFKYGSQPGWTSLVVLILITTGVLLTSLGIIGLYVGKIFDQSKERPLFVVDTVIGDGMVQQACRR